MVGSRPAGTEAAVEKGYLLERYYDNSTGVFYSKNADGKPCARALAQTYAKGFYMGLRAGLYFELDESGRTVTATVTIFRDADMTDAVFSDSSSTCGTTSRSKPTSRRRSVRRHKKKKCNPAEHRRGLQR